MSKIVVVGDKSVGKSALIARMFGLPFEPTYNATIAGDFKYLELGDKRHQIVDCSGDPRFQAFVNSHYINANIALVCVDISQPINLEHLKSYFSRLRQYAPKVTCILVGTKADLATEQQKEDFFDITLPEISIQIGEEKKEMKDRILTSAKNRTQIQMDLLQKELFEIASLLSPQESLNKNCTEQKELSAGFFLKVAQHSATGVIGGLLMIAGLLALGIGIACLCPPLIPVMAGLGIALSPSVATSTVIAGGIATLVGTVATYFHKKNTDTNVAGLSFDDNSEHDSEIVEHEPESLGNLSF